MSACYTCGSEVRRDRIRGSAQPINGLDHLELLPPARPDDAGASLLVHLLKEDGVGLITPELVTIRGGRRLTRIAVQGVAPATALLPGSEGGGAWGPLGWTAEAAQALSAALPDPGAAARVLVVRAWPRGDLAPYTLSITSPPNLLFDRQLQSVDFTFQVSGESELDCGAAPPAASPPAAEPEIDYLAKDYSSFRRLMMDRLSALLPDWTERSPADLGVTLVEALAAAGDSLSYYQDAVATEAYLGTARQRISVRRHARLLDARMHDGCNARTFVVLEVDAGASDLPLRLFPGPDVAVQFLTAVDALPAVASLDQIDASLLGLAEVFEPLHDVLLRGEHNAIPFHTWGEERRRLPAGATSATLRNRGGGLKLAAGDLLLLEEVRDPSSGDPAEARADHRQVVRLTSVTYTSDPLYGEATEAPYTGTTANPDPLQVAEVTWSSADALAFDLCVGALPGPLPLSVARGNVVLADHGRSVIPEEEIEVGDDVELHPPRLKQLQVTQQGRVRDQRGALVLVDPKAPASHALAWEMQDVQPCVLLAEQRSATAEGTTPPRPRWVPRSDLLASDRFASELVVEVDDAERAWLRFGDDLEGRRPLGGTRFSARYRVGNGSRGNVSAEALRHVLFSPRSGRGDPGRFEGIVGARNPLPAVGGREPQAIDEVRLLAPTAFRTQQRAVSEADYAAIAARHPEVEKAAASFRWTGSWHTVFLLVARRGGAAVDDDFRARLGAFMDRYRMTRHDLRIEAPRYVALDISFDVHVDASHLRSAVRKVLLEVLGNAVLPDGTPGYFHRSRWTFGQPVVLSRLIAAAMAVPGVSRVDFEGRRFQRWGVPPADELARGWIDIGPLEIAQLDDDAGSPENGRLELSMQGGM